MKHWLLAAALVCFGTIAQASPYFRFADPQHPSFKTGSCLDAEAIGQSEACILVPLIRHGHADGYLIFPGEDWSPLAIGGAISGGHSKFILGPTANLSPLGNKLLLSLVNAVTADGHFENLKSLLTPVDGAPSDISIAIGPVLEYDPLVGRNGKGYFRIFSGAAWHF